MAYKKHDMMDHRTTEHPSFRAAKKNLKKAAGQAEFHGTLPANKKYPGMPKGWRPGKPIN